MKNILKKLIIGCFALSVAFCTTGCAEQTQIIIPPQSGITSDGTNNNVSSEVGLTAGFEMKYDSGLEDKSGSSVNMYDDRYYYLNQIRENGADPGVCFISHDEALDSYEKLLAKEKAQKGSLFNLDEFDALYGTKTYWEENYADKFYMVTTGSCGTNLSTKTKQKYPNALYGMFYLRASDDLNDWYRAGEIDGYAVMAENNYWSTATSENPWAPEIIRDPLSGLFFVCASTNSRNGNENTEYNPTTDLYGTSDENFDRMSLMISVSPTPIGPYRVITADEYYSYLTAYNMDGSVKTVTVNEGGVEKTMAVYRDDLVDDYYKGKDLESTQKSDTVLLTEYKNGEFINLNGDKVGKLSPPLNFGYYHDKIKEAYPHWWIENRGIFPAIDLNPVIDSKGDLYMYFSQHISSLVYGNFVWVVKMKDWVSPDWETLTRIAAPSYSIVYSDGVTAEKQYYSTYEKQSDNTYKKHEYGEGKAYAINGIMGYYMGSASEHVINEGTYVIEKDGWYYFTYSPLGYTSRRYAIYQAVSNNPYGPFIKIPDYSPIIGLDRQEDGDNIAGTGHHAFVWAGDELYAVYHCFYNPVNNNNTSGSFLGRGIAVDKVNFCEYDGITFGSLIQNQIEKDIAEEDEEQSKGEKRVDNRVLLNDDFTLTKEWIRARFADCNGSNYYGEASDVIVNEDRVVPILYGNGPTYSLQPLPQFVLPDGYSNVADEATVEIIYGDESSKKYANDGMFTFQRWSSKYEVVGDASMGQIKLKLKWSTPQTIRNIMIYNSREYSYGFTQIKSIVFALAKKPDWYPSENAYNGYAYIKDLKADPQGWNTNNFTMRKGGSAMATFDSISVNEIIITVSALDKIDTSLGKNIVKLSEIYIMGKPTDSEN